MKNLLLALMLLLPAGRALALDVPPGADALGYQLRAATSAVLAQVVDNRGALVLRTQAVFSGQAPSTLSLAQDEYVRGARLAVGGVYLVFLGAGANGEPALPLSLYSLVPARLEDASALKAAVAEYVRTEKDPAAFRKVGLALSGSPLPYLQYSAVADLARRGLLTSADADLLGRWGLTRGVQPEVRKLAIRKLGQVQAKGYAEKLGAVLGSPEEPTSVRVAALDALSSMGALDVIRRQARSVSESPSPKLKNRLMSAVGAL